MYLVFQHSEGNGHTITIAQLLEGNELDYLNNESTCSIPTERREPSRSFLSDDDGECRSVCWGFAKKMQAKC